MITAELVKQLREKTGAGMMDCKKALTEVGGDIEKAIDFLREKGLASAAKKTGRVAAEGAVDTHISEDGKTAVITEVNCETDFVAKNDGFRNFIKEIGEFVAKSKVADLAEELNAKAKSVIANIGENIVVRRYEKYDMSEPGVFGSYIHMGGKIGVLVQLACDDIEGRAEELKNVAKDIAMHIAAANPAYLDKENVPTEVLEHEKEILKKQAMEEGKPANIAEKMVEGRVGKMYKEICLMEQPFVKDPDKSIRQYVEEKAKELGTKIDVKKFTRFMTGEGIEKKQENFAEEIEKQINGGN